MTEQLVIWKFPFALVDKLSIPMPEGAHILTVQMQFNHGCLWALCNPSARREQRTFAIYRTGGFIDEHPGRYIGTFQIDGGEYVFHVFEEEA